MSVLVLALVNAVLFGVLAVAALRASRAERSDRIRDLWRVLALATSLIALGSVRRAFVRASRLEWVSSDVEEFLLGDFVWAQSVATAGVGLLAWLAIRRAGRPRYEADFTDLGAGAQVNVATGNVIISGSDVTLPTVQGSLAFTRAYNSQGAALDGPLGWGWAMAMPVDGAPAAFTTLTHHDDDGDYVEVLDVSGEALYFLSDGSGGWLPEAGAEGVTLALASGVWTLTDIDETAYKFTDAGPGDPSLLTEAVPSSGPGVSYTYDGQDRLIEVTDPTGYKSFVLEYGTNGKLARIKAAFDANTVVAEYDYDINGHLIEVTDPRTGLSW